MTKFGEHMWRPAFDQNSKTSFISTKFRPLHVIPSIEFSLNFEHHGNTVRSYLYIMITDLKIYNKVYYNSATTVTLFIPTCTLAR